MAIRQAKEYYEYVESKAHAPEQVGQGRELSKPPHCAPPMPLPSFPPAPQRCCPDGIPTWARHSHHSV